MQQPTGDRVKRLRNETAELSEADPKDNRPLPITDSILLCMVSVGAALVVSFCSTRVALRPVIVIKAGRSMGTFTGAATVVIDHVSLRQGVLPERLWETHGSPLAVRGVFRLWTGMAIFPQGSYSLSAPVAATPCCFFPVR
jgi:hypothetical protein